MNTINLTDDQFDIAADALSEYYSLCDDFDDVETKAECRERCVLLNNIRATMAALAPNSITDRDLPELIDVDAFVADRFEEGE